MSALGTFFNVSTPRIRLKVHPWAKQTNVTNNDQRTVIVINEQLGHNQQMVIHKQ